MNTSPISYRYTPPSVRFSANLDDLSPGLNGALTYISLYIGSPSNKAKEAVTKAINVIMDNAKTADDYLTILQTITVIYASVVSVSSTKSDAQRIKEITDCHQLLDPLWQKAVAELAKESA